MQNKISITAIASFFFGNGVAGVLAYWGNTLPALILSIVSTVVGIALGVWVLFISKSKIRLSLKEGGNRMLIVLGILTIIAGFVSGGILIKSQLNFHTDETTTDVKQQLNTPVVASTSTSQSQNTVGTMGLEMPTYIDARQQVSLEFGGTLFAFKWGDLAKGSVMPVIIAGQTVPLKIFADDNHLLWVDVSIIGMGNLPIVELKKNTLQNGIPSGWDYNSDRNIFEVVNQNLEPVLQVIRMGPFSERVNGIFPLSNGGLVQASPSGGAQYYGPGVANQAPLQGFHLDPIFKYPSNQYLGVQVTSE